MGRSGALGVVRWMSCWALVGATAPVVWAQSAQQAALVGAKAHGVDGAYRSNLTPWPQKVVKFSDGKAVSGLPVGGAGAMAHCSDDNVAFINASGQTTADATGVPELYRVETNGEVRHLLRKIPDGFQSVSVRDFYAGEHTLVTLLEAVKRDDDSSPVRETGYFLSVSNHDGDFGDLLQMDARFRPLKIAVFGAGDFLVLGWDEANLLPKLALLKDDGTVRRFIDLEERSGKSTVTAALGWGDVNLKSLQGAKFVPYGSEVLLTYPGTAKAIGVLNAAGQVRSIPIALPGGYVLHDVLFSGGGRGGTLMLRAQAPKDPDKVADDPPQRLFEMSSYSGALVREFVFDKPRVSEVACAANSSLTAIFMDSMDGSDHPATSASGGSAPAEVPTQLVVATVRR